MMYTVTYELNGKQLKVVIEALTEDEAYTKFHEQYGYEPRVKHIKVCR